MTCSLNVFHHLFCIQGTQNIMQVTTSLVSACQAQAMSKDAALAEGIWADMGTGSGALAVSLAKCMTGAGQVGYRGLLHLLLSALGNSCLAREGWG